MIQMNTTIIDMEKLNNSAEVKRPQNPKEILLVLPQGLKNVKKSQKLREMTVDTISYYIFGSVVNFGQK